jgi:hypothetical protein
VSIIHRKYVIREGIDYFVSEGTWTDEEIDLLIKSVNKYKSEMKVTKDEDISWKYVSAVFKGKRNLLQLRHKWYG